MHYWAKRRKSDLPSSNEENSTGQSSEGAELENSAHSYDIESDGYPIPDEDVFIPNGVMSNASNNRMTISADHEAIPDGNMANTRSSSDVVRPVANVAMSGGNVASASANFAERPFANSSDRAYVSDRHMASFNSGDNRHIPNFDPTIPHGHFDVPQGANAVPVQDESNSFPREPVVNHNIDANIFVLYRRHSSQNPHASSFVSGDANNRIAVTDYTDPTMMPLLLPVGFPRHFVPPYFVADDSMGPVFVPPAPPATDLEFAGAATHHNHNDGRFAHDDMDHTSSTDDESENDSSLEVEIGSPEEDAFGAYGASGGAEDFVHDVPVFAETESNLTHPGQHSLSSLQHAVSLALRELQSIEEQGHDEPGDRNRHAEHGNDDYENEQDQENANRENVNEDANGNVDYGHGNGYDIPNEFNGVEGNAARVILAPMPSFDYGEDVMTVNRGHDSDDTISLDGEDEMNVDDGGIDSHINANADIVEIYIEAKKVCNVENNRKDAIRETMTTANSSTSGTSTTGTGSPDYSDDSEIEVDIVGVEASQRQVNV